MRLPTRKFESVEDLGREYELYGLEGVHDLEEFSEKVRIASTIESIRFELGLDTNLPKIIAKQYRRI